MIRYILAIMLLLPLVSQGQIISSAAIMELQNMDYSAPCAACSAWRYSRTDAKLYRWSGTAWNEVDLPLNNEIQTLSISNDTIFLSNGGFVKVPAATVSGVQGTISYWASPQSFGSLFIGDGLGRDGDTLLVTQVLDSTRLIQDSILVYYQDSLEVGRDTINIPQVAFDNYTIKGPPYRVDTSIIVSHVQLTNYSLDPKINSAWFASDLDTLTDEARLEYNATYGTLQFGMDRNVPVEIGQALYNEPVVNKTGVTLVKGTLLMVDTSQFTQGNRLRVMPANALLPPDLIVGVAAEDIGINSEGFVLWFGQLQASLTLLQPVGETWAAGDLLYPHPTINGRLTKVLPQNGFLKTPVAVIKDINGNNVIFKVRIKIGEYLRNITDVAITSPANGSVLMYNNGLWTDSLTTFLDSITFSVPNYMTVSPTTLSNSGTVTLGFGNQSSNTVFAGPTAAGSGQPSFRTLAASDLQTAGGVTGLGASGQVSFYTGNYTQGGDTSFTWDNTNKSLLLGGGTTNASSLLTLNSTTRGILIPRMTTTEKNAIVAPATGLLVYDLTLGAFNVYNGSAWVSVGGGLPAGSNGQIQFNNNNVFGASSNLFWDNNNNRLGIGNSTPASTLTVQGSGTTSSTTSLSVIEGNSNAIFRVRNDGRLLIGSNNSQAPQIAAAFSNNFNNSGLNLAFYTFGNGAAETGAWWFTGDTWSQTSGNLIALNVDKSFSPTSGTATFSQIQSRPTINQTGGANGITRGLYVNPTLTSAADWRSIQFDNNTGWGLYGNGTANNYLAGNLTIGNPVVAARLSVRGSGSDNNASSLLIQNSLARTLFSVRNDGLAQLGRNTAVTTQEVAQIQVVSDDTNTGLVITPKGTGAFIVGPAPDGTATGGNARGANAVDLQISRTSNSRIASGESSVIAGGTNNTAQGAGSVVTGGQSNIASGVRSSVIGGEQNIATGNYSAMLGGLRGSAGLYGQVTHASGMFDVTGDAQNSIIKVRRVVNNSTSELFLDGASSRAIIAPNSPNTSRVWNARLQCVAVTNVQGTGGPTAGSVFSETMDITIKRIGSVTSIVNGTPMQSVSVSDIGMSGADFLVDADDTNESLRVRFQPPTIAAADTQIRAVCTVYLTEIGY